MEIKKKKLKEKIKLQIQINEQQAKKNVQAGKKIFFPYELYDQQKAIIQTIHKTIQNKGNALIQSPTGTGKTLCLLVGALSYFCNKNQKSKIIYLTRTHSQISQIVSQLKKCSSYKFKMTIIGSKQWMCINKSLRQLKGRVLDKKCENFCSTGMCNYKQFNSNIQVPILDLKQLKQYGLKNRFCPYFYSKAIQNQSQVLIIPYNYLLSSQLLQKTQIDLQDSILIFDQAHNIDNVAEQGCTFTLSSEILKVSIKNIKQYIEKLQKNVLKATVSKQIQSAYQFKQILQNLYNGLDKINQNKKFISFRELFKQIQNLTKSSKNASGYFSEGLNKNNAQQYIVLGKQILADFSKRNITNFVIEQILRFFQSLYFNINQNNSKQYSIYILKEKQKNLIKINCLSSSVIFQKIRVLRPKSIILSSGTLSPLQYWQQQLKIHFLYRLVNQSYITKNHLYASIIKNYKNQQFQFSFHKKNDVQQLENLMELINQIGVNTPNGVIVAFSSYELMELLLACFPQNKFNKKIFKETKDSDAENIMKKYQNQCKKNGAYLFMIMRGKFSEGIDFANELCRSMIIVGIPFAPPFDKKIEDKRKYIDSLKLQHMNSQQWYLLQTMRTVNQTIGRSIRHKNDFSGVFLVDKRYQRSNLLDYVPHWFKKCLRNQISKMDMDKFYKRQFIQQIKQNINKQNLQQKGEDSSKNTFKTFKTAKQLIYQNKYSNIQQITTCETVRQLKFKNSLQKDEKTKIIDSLQLVVKPQNDISQCQSVVSKTFPQRDKLLTQICPVIEFPDCEYSLTMQYCKDRKFIKKRKIQDIKIKLPKFE